MIVFFSLRIGTSILAASSLSFLGLGAKPESPDWGAMLSMGRDYLATSPHVVMIPGLAIFLSVLAFNLVISQAQLPTTSEDGEKAVIERVLAAIESVMSDKKVNRRRVRGVGIASAGVIDSKTNEIIFASNLGWSNVPIVSLNPDLIIGNKVRHEKIYDQLSKVAPTVFSEELSGRWKTNFALYAETLNKKAEGEKVMKEFDDRVAAAKEKLGPKAAMKVSVAKFSKKGVQIYQKDTFSGVLFEQLGVARPASQDVNNFAELLSEEGMSAIRSAIRGKKNILQID